MGRVCEFLHLDFGFPRRRTEFPLHLGWWIRHVVKVCGWSIRLIGQDLQRVIVAVGALWFYDYFLVLPDEVSVSSAPMAVPV